MHKRAFPSVHHRTFIVVYGRADLVSFLGDTAKPPVNFRVIRTIFGQAGKQIFSLLEPAQLITYYSLARFCLRVIFINGQTLIKELLGPGVTPPG